MVKKQVFSIALILVGAALAAFAFMADLIGVGVVTGIGYKQFLTGMAGIILAILGIILLPKKW
jgi:hypothetical protein